MLDYDIRLKAMDEAGVDIAVISLTAPNVYWGTRKQSAAAARAINDDYRDAEQKHDGRIRWFASLPWQNADDSIEELKRAKKNGALGICMLTNILGHALTEEQYRPIWREIEAMQLPVFVHPTLPFVDGMGLKGYGLGNTIGFTTETSLCFARMILDGFLDDFPHLNDRLSRRRRAALSHRPLRPDVGEEPGPAQDRDTAKHLSEPALV